jgi:uncharacterized protein YbjT (DUF2867 family)
MSMEHEILVTGGTGTLGRELVEQLRSDGHKVRVLSRRLRPGSDTVVGDLTANTGLDAAVQGIDTIVHCATDGRTDLEATRNLLAAAERAGISHFVYISIVGVDRHPLFYYRTKFRVEQLVEASPVPWTIVRATQFHNLVHALFRGQRWLPVLFTPSFSFQPISVRDVARRLAEAAAAGPVGRATDIGGPEVLSCRELAAAYLSHTGRRRPLVPLRLPGKTFAAYVAGYHLTPEHRYGTGTFAGFLTELGSR